MLDYRFAEMNLNILDKMNRSAKGTEEVRFELTLRVTPY